MAEAERAVGTATRTRDKAERLTRYVNALLDKKPTAVSPPRSRCFARRSATATNTRRCMSPWLAPPVFRRASRLVYVRGAQGAFYYHAWPEVYLEESAGRGLWLPVDPTLNQFPADGTHLRLVRGGLDEQAAILPHRPSADAVLDMELDPQSTPVLVGAAETSCRCLRLRRPNLPQLARSAPRETGNQPRAPAGHQGQSPRLVRAGATNDCRHEPRQAIRRTDGGGRGEPLRQAGRNSRLPGTEWRWKDDHDQDDRRALQPTAGRVVVNGHDMAEEPELSFARFHSRPAGRAHEKLTAAEFLRFHGGHGIADNDIGARVREMLDLFELRRWEDGLVESFSHGMKQRLVMSAAFLHRPKAVVVDEPMVGLDPRGAP